MYNIDNPDLAYLKRDLNKDVAVYYAVDDENMTIDILLVRSRKTEAVKNLDFRTKEIRELFVSKISEDAPIDLETLRKICAELELSYGYLYGDDEYTHIATPDGEIKLSLDGEKVLISEGRYSKENENEWIAFSKEDMLDMKDYHFDVIFINIDKSEEEEETQSAYTEEKSYRCEKIDSIPGSNMKPGDSMSMEEFLNEIANIKAYFRGEGSIDKASMIRQLRQKSDSIIDRNWLRAGDMTEEELDDFEKNQDYFELLDSTIKSMDNYEQVWTKYKELCSDGRRQALNIEKLKNACGFAEDIKLYNIPFFDVCEALQALATAQED